MLWPFLVASRSIESCWRFLDSHLFVRKKLFRLDQDIKARLPREEGIKRYHVLCSSLAEGSLSCQVIFKFFSGVVELVEVEQVVSYFFHCHLLFYICLDDLRLALL